MTLDSRLDAYSRGELTLGQLLDVLPDVADGSPDLIAFLDALEDGRVPSEVVQAWSHPDGGLARHAHVPAFEHSIAEESDGKRAWKFLPKNLSR